MWSLARRPRWIAALVLALAIAAGFAALGQWQIDRSIEQATVVDYESERVVPLDTLAQPQSPVTADAAYRIVSVSGTLVAGDNSVISGRVNGGEVGYWVLGHLVTENGASLAVALGWAATQDEADAAASNDMAIQALLPYVGRYQPTESPQDSDFEAGERTSVSVSALINEWATPVESVYGGYLVVADAPDGLTTIDSPRPSDEVSINWLNIFYAVEWAVFAVFAVYLWFRLVKDAWEREQEEAAEAEAEAAAAAGRRDRHPESAEIN